MADEPGALPETIAPMLCASSEPFDSDDWHFEIKWDGVRAVAYVDAAGPRLSNRRARAISERYPELLEALATLPPGTVLDGEIIVFGDDGRPDFPRVLQREQARGLRIETLARTLPACFVAFDHLYADGTAQMSEPFCERRASLDALELDAHGPRLACASGVACEGISYFEAVRSRGLEGLVAKRLDAPYVPGKRTDTWRKIKVARERPCVVIGWLPSGRRDIRSLLLATDFEDGQGLRYVGKAGSGIADHVRRELLEQLEGLEVARAIVDCDESNARFVDPQLFVLVRYTELTKSGRLRSPVFLRVLRADA